MITPFDIAAFEGYLIFFVFFAHYNQVKLKKCNNHSKNALQSAACSNKVNIVINILLKIN